MKNTVKVYAAAIYRAIIRPILSFLAVLVFLLWTVGSGVYLMFVIPSIFFEGKSFLISGSASNVEWCFLGVALFYWLVIIGCVIIWRMSKELKSR